MKLWLKRYQVVSICLSLMIVSLAFVIGSDGAYGAGSMREWVRNRMAACVLQGMLAVCMLAGGIMSLVQYMV